MELFAKEEFDKEEVFDTKIQPLLAQIIAIAEEHELPITWLATQRIIDKGDQYNFLNSVISMGYTAQMTPLQFLVGVLAQLPTEIQREICDQVVLQVYEFSKEAGARLN